MGLRKQTVTAPSDRLGDFTEEFVQLAGKYAFHKLASGLQSLRAVIKLLSAWASCYANEEVSCSCVFYKYN